MKIQCILSHGAKFPTRGTKESAGLDLRIKGYKIIKDSGFIEEAVWFDEEKPHDHMGTLLLQPGERILALTGIKMNIPKYVNEGFVYEMQVRPRSGNALKHGITVLNTPGTIDQDYQGDIGVILINASKRAIQIDDGAKIAQLVINIVPVNEEFEEVTTFETKTERGAGGFGSTGV